MGEVILDTSHDVPMCRDGTKLVATLQYKIVHHYDVVMMHLCRNIFVDSSCMHWQGA